MKHKAILSSLLGKTFKMTQDEIAELIEKAEDEINESEVLDSLVKRDADRVTALRTRLFAEGAKKAEANIKKTFNANLRTAFELDEETSDDDLVETIKTKIATTKKSATTLTDDDVKKHPAYLSAEANFKKMMAESKKLFETELNTFKSSVAKKEVQSKVGAKAIALFQGLNPILSSDAAKAGKQTNNFISAFVNKEWEEADGEFYLVEDGKRKEDEHGHALSLNALVKKEAETLFDFKKAEARKGAGEHHNPGKGKGDEKPENHTYTGKLASSQKEYNEMMNNRAIPLKDRQAIHAAWEAKSGETE